MAAGKSSTVPSWAKRKIASADLDLIERAIEAFESRVAGEILPIMTRSSVSIAFARGYWFFILSTFALLAELHFEWGWIVLGAILIFLAPLAWILSRSFKLSLWLLPPRDQDFECHEAAELEFYRFQINQTSEHGGILLYLSWIERRVVILVDPLLDQRIDPTIWKRAMVLMQTHLREKKVALAYVKAIEFLADQLAPLAPLPGGGARPKNELSNRLIIR